MEIIRQTRPSSSSSQCSFRYCIYMMSPCGDFLRLGGWDNYWNARHAYIEHVEADKDTKFLLVGSECDPSHFRPN